MRSTRQYFLLALIVILCNCKGLYQNDYLLDCKLIQLDSNSAIGYKLYQTGFDNYRYEFYATINSDTTKLFNSFLNDATYKNARFNTQINLDTIIIDCNFNLGIERNNFKKFVVQLK
jgi:hypothetical protein